MKSLQWPSSTKLIINHLKIAKEYLSEHHIEDAIIELQKILEIDSRNLQVHRNSSILYAQQEEYIEAINASRNLLEIRNNLFGCE